MTIRNEMRRIEFHDRRRERKEIKSILEREPSLITFIYGPINSGKTALVPHPIKQLPEDYVIYELFNFFIDLTKEKHLAHVFVATSDSLFIERIYSEAMLEGWCRYLLVDGFNETTTTTLLDRYGFTADDKAVAWEYCGGKHVCLVELINEKLSSGNIKQRAEKMLEGVISRLIFLLARNRERKNDIIEMPKCFTSGDGVKYTDSMNLELLSFLAKQNILLFDLAVRSIKPRSNLDLLAIHEVMKEV